MATAAVLGGVLALPLCCWAEGAVKDLPFKTIEQGSQSGISDRKFVTVSTDADWSDLWRKHTANILPAPVRAKVDFAKEMVIAAFSGQRNSGGYTIKIERIESTPRETIVRIKESSPPPGSINTMAITQPFKIVRVSKNGIAQKVRFNVK